MKCFKQFCLFLQIKTGAAPQTGSADCLCVIMANHFECKTVIFLSAYALTLSSQIKVPHIWSIYLSSQSKFQKTKAHLPPLKTCPAKWEQSSFGGHY